MLSGDDHVIAQAAPVLGDVAYAQVKKSTGYFSGDHLPLEDSRRLLHETAKRAVAGANAVAPVTCELPVTIEVDLSPDPENDPALGARKDDCQRFLDQSWGDEPLSDVDLVLTTHPQVSSPQSGTVSFTCSDYPSAYVLLHSVLLEIYERDIENLIDEIADPRGYERPDLPEIVGGHSETESEAPLTR